MTMRLLNAGLRSFAAPNQIVRAKRSIKKNSFKRNDDLLAIQDHRNDIGNVRDRIICQKYPGCETPTKNGVSNSGLDIVSAYISNAMSIIRIIVQAQYKRFIAFTV